jgi:FkbM family methyltransferase
MTTRVARRATGADVEVLYDGLWMHRIGGILLPDSSTYDYHSGSFEHWPRQVERALADTRDYWLHAYTPRPGDVVVDIGAGRGEDTLCLSRLVGKEGLVIAVEGNPSSFGMLERFARLNDLRNVHAVNTVIADRPGTFRITTDDDWQSNSILSGPDPQPGRGVAVAGTTVDLLCESLELPRIDFLKMNIEGAERLAVHGMKQVLRTVRHLCIACHDFRADRGEGEQYRSRDHVVDFLRAQGLALSFRRHDARPSVRDYVYGAQK